jgi:hypothetical protein
MTEASAGSRQAQVALAVELRKSGQSWVSVAAALRERFGLNARTAMRVAHAWSQNDVSTEWSARWPDDVKTFKNISSWERWPETGHAPSLDVLSRLAELYSCSLSDLVADLADFRASDVPPQNAIPDPSNFWPSPKETPGNLSPASKPPRKWYVEALRSLVRLDLAVPEVIEERRIVSTVDNLTELSTSITIPQEVIEAGKPLSTDIQYGGILTADEHAIDGRYGVTIQIGHRLMVGDRYEYSVRHRLTPTRPHYVCQPLVRCDYFELRIRFDQSHRPAAVYRLDGLVPRALDDGTTDVPVELDRIGEAVVRFQDLDMGLAYGLRWHR